MSEIKSNDINTTDAGVTFDPDKRIECNEIRNVYSHNDYDPDKRVEASNKTENNLDAYKDANWGGKYTSPESRFGMTPTENNIRGSWKGDRGQSVYVPSETTTEGREAKEKLSKYGLDGIEYKNFEPDFSRCSEGTVKIENMTEFRYGDTHNFRQADIELAQKWNEEHRNGRSDYTYKDVEQYRIENNLSWHERCDMKTVDLVPNKIHGYFTHSGGVAECKAKLNKGAIFDE